jgi:hypothetical protein
MKFWSYIRILFPLIIKILVRRIDGNKIIERDRSIILYPYFRQFIFQDRYGINYTMWAKKAGDYSLPKIPLDRSNKFDAFKIMFGESSEIVNFHNFEDFNMFCNLIMTYSSLKMDNSIKEEILNFLKTIRL